MQQKHTLTTMESAVLLLPTNGWCVFSEVLLCLKIINYWWSNEDLDESVKNHVAVHFNVVRYYCVRSCAPQHHGSICDAQHQTTSRYLLEHIKSNVSKYVIILMFYNVWMKCKVNEHIKRSAKNNFLFKSLLYDCNVPYYTCFMVIISIDIEYDIEFLCSLHLFKSILVNIINIC